MRHDLLKGEKIRLREMRSEDCTIMHDWENRPELDHLGDEHAPLSKTQIAEFIKRSSGDIYSDGQLRLMIDAENSTVGCIDLFEFDAHNLRAGVGILIAENENRGRGFAKEALQLLIQYCFDVMNMKQLYCHIPADNEASIQLFSTCGFEENGRCRDWVRKGNLFIDAVFMQKLNG